MKRVVSLYLPNWPIDRLRRRLGDAAPPPERPMVLVGRDRRRRILTACSPAARALGLRPGMAATQAHALAPDLSTFDAEPGRDAEALERLALWALRRYAPICAADEPDGLAIDATGAAHLRSGEAGLLQDMETRLGAAGIQARAAIAPTYGAAWALARFASAPTMVAEGEVGAALAPLPLAALRLEPDLLDALGRMGFETVLDLERQPRAPLSLRFGPQPGRRLDQALGRMHEPITPVSEGEQPCAERVFAEPIGAPETLERYAALLVDDLCAQLERAGTGARRLDWLCHRVDNRIEAVRISLARPVRDRRRLTRLLRDRVESIAPGFGIERMTLAASITLPLNWRPGPSGLSDPDVPDVAALVDLLVNRVGAGRLYKLEPRESDVPERSVRRTEPLAASTLPAWAGDWPRPIRLFRTPEPVETLALLPDNPPAWFTWRGVRRRISRADGPERIYGEWGCRDAELWAVRDYFQVEDEAGERFWLFRAGDGEDARTGAQNWFIHGKFG
ncbi:MULTISPECIES: Y-family DNA polymerase [unclassified Brevundimonas]|uniref:Y-family DNA polymerase n=1 Tax=unclassified Brevundimonas TaxID=2622653 RepID=UPI0025C6B37F|nr:MULTISPECIES: DNA polymerase Y family protein [unclassified Brevundimonas]